MNPGSVKQLARECGFELAGIAPALPLPETAWYREWVERGMAGEMSYLTDRRAEVRADPRLLLPSVQSIICLGKLYNTPHPYSTEFQERGRAWISRYAWGRDYHDVIRGALRSLARKMADASPRPFKWKACVDTAPLLERAYARRAGLGWIGKNTCLIHQGGGSWYFLAALLVSLELAPDRPQSDRCGSCTRCIDACPTRAIVPTGRAEGPSHTVDSRRCISYLTIERPGEIPGMGSNVFGCDICQDVCPWNRNAPSTTDPAFSPTHFAPPLAALARLNEESFLRTFQGSAVLRAGCGGLLGNVARIVRDVPSPGHDPDSLPASDS